MRYQTYYVYLGTLLILLLLLSYLSDGTRRLEVLCLRCHRPTWQPLCGSVRPWAEIIQGETEESSLFMVTFW